MMYNPQLETFPRVADAGSFNKAAEELFITPPAVIKQITSLESSLDLKLFIRSPRGLKLTEAGKSIYRDAQYVVQYCKDSVVRAKNAAEEGGQGHPHRGLPHDAGAVSAGSVARHQKILPGHQIQDGPLRKYPGELGGDPAEPGAEHRHRGRAL